MFRLILSFLLSPTLPCPLASVLKFSNCPRYTSPQKTFLDRNELKNYTVQSFVPKGVETLALFQLSASNLYSRFQSAYRPDAAPTLRI